MKRASLKSLNPAQRSAAKITDFLTKKAPKTFFGKIFSLPGRLFNLDFGPFVDAGFKRLEFIFRPLERFIPALRPKTIAFALNHDIFGEVDKRENFLPVRFQTIADQIVAAGKTEEEREKWRLFAERCAERYHVDFFRDITRLNNAFAIFDPDADAQYEPETTPEEKEARRKEFFDGALKILKDGNFVELPREEMTRLLNLRRPASLPIEARYDDFEEYRVFIRGSVKTEPHVYPRWKCAGRFVTVESEMLSRVCVLARMREEAENGVVDEKIVLKLFKNLLLEDLKQASPRVELKFPLFDGIKIGGGFAGASGIAILKTLSGSSLVSSAGSIVSFLATSLLSLALLLPLFLLYMLKSAFGFINRRTSYLQQYSSSLYFQTLASNRAAISLLVSLAEDQEVKEIVLGYFAASKFATWTPEKPIDLVAETWLADKFGVDVDFESDDAIRKLLEKRLIERRENENGELEYRAVSLDEALRRLEVDWNALVVAPLGDAA